MYACMVETSHNLCKSTTRVHAENTNVLHTVLQFTCKAMQGRAQSKCATGDH